MDNTGGTTKPKTKLNGNTFLIINKKYAHAKLDMPKESSTMYTSESFKVQPGQFWQLKEGVSPGYYYIYNAQVKYNDKGYRLAKWGPLDTKVGPYWGKYYEDQLWKFEHVKDDYYRICNKKYPAANITKSGIDDTEVGTDKKTSGDEQLWKLVPRYKAKVSQNTIWECDNRKGSEDFSQEIIVTTGLKQKLSASLSIKVGFEESLKAAASEGVASVEATEKFSLSIEASITGSVEKDWSRETKVKFTAPKGKNYRVKQNSLHFKSPLADDDCALKCNYVVEETDGDFQN